MIDTAHLCLTQDGCLRIGLCLWTGEESGVAFPGQSHGPFVRNSFLSPLILKRTKYFTATR